jgi:flagellar P-ring protein FlgI
MVKATEFNIKIVISCLILVLIILVTASHAAVAPAGIRIKDLAALQGTNTNQLIGYGLVTGLRNTGDRTKTLSAPMLKNMFENMGLKMDPTELTRLQTKNAAVVMVTADLPSSFRSGDSMDITVSSVGDATSIDGGVLLLTTLRGPDGRVYASAQGPVAVGLDPADTNNRKKYLVGRIPDGGLIARDMDTPVVRNGRITWVLRNPDFATAVRIAKVINSHYNRQVASASGDRFVEVECIGLGEDPIIMAARIGQLRVSPDNIARVVVNERTGTVIMGSDVKISPVSISHANLTLRVAEKGLQPANPVEMNGAAGLGQPPVRHDRMFTIGENATVQDVIDIVNNIGITPKDLITILQALKNAGALQGELFVQ